MGVLRFTKRVLARSFEQDIAEDAAAAAFHLFFALFAAILGLFALTGFIGGAQVFDWLMRQLREVMPESAAEYIGRFAAEVTGSRRPDVVAFGFVVALGVGSNVLMLLTKGLNRVYAVEETRSWWLRRVSAVGGLAGFMLLLVVVVLGVLVAPELLERFGIHPVLSVLRWPVIFGLSLLILTSLYVLMPNRSSRRSLRPTVGGAAVGSVLWVSLTLALRAYVASFDAFSRVYGFVGAIMALLVWLYLTALAFLFGAEVAAELERRPC